MTRPSSSKESDAGWFPEVLLAALSISASKGGMPKTLGLFQAALDAEVVQFGDEGSSGVGGRTVDRATAVPVSRWPVLRKFGYVPRRGREALNDMAAQVDLISCHSSYRFHAVWTGRMSRRYDIPYWMVPHGVLDPYVLTSRAFVKRWFNARFGRELLRNARRVIFATRAEEAKARDQFEVPESAVLYWPVELPSLSRRAELRRRFREREEVAHDARVLLHFGRLHPMKRTLETIDAFAGAVGDDPLRRLIVAGMEDGVSLEDCRRRADRHGASNVDVLGPRYGVDKMALLFGSDGYISLSHRENFNHSAAEALAAGLPLVLSQGNDLGHDLREARCVWMLPAWSPAAAVEAIESFFSADRQELAAMGERGRSWVAEHLDFDDFREKLRNLARNDVKR